MPEEKIEDKEKVEAPKTFDEKFDKEFDNLEKPSAPEKDTEEKPEESPTAEVDKTEEIKKVDEDVSLSVEDKIEKIKEILGDDEKAVEAYVKQRGFHTDPAWIKQREQIDRLKTQVSKGALTEEQEAQLDDFNKVTSSPEYIQLSMKQKGFTQDAIDAAFREKGFKVPEKAGDDVELIMRKLNIDPKTVDEGLRATITDVAKIVRVLQDETLGKKLPEALKPLQDHQEKVDREEGSRKMIQTMQDVVKKEDILDYKKDIEPEINKFMDEHEKDPNFTQDDILDHFHKLNHKLSLERMRTGKKKVERDESKGNLRQNKPRSPAPDLSKVEKTGNFDKDFDAAADAIGLN